MKTISNKLLLALAAILLLASMLMGRNDYMTEQAMHVKIVDKMILAGSKGRENLYIVYMTDENYVFDYPTTVGRYSQAIVGTYKTIYLRPFDVRQTSSQNILWFFLPCLLFSAGIAIPLTLLVAKLMDQSVE